MFTSRSTVGLTATVVAAAAWFTPDAASAPVPPGNTLLHSNNTFLPPNADYTLDHPLDQGGFRHSNNTLDWGNTPTPVGPGSFSNDDYFLHSNNTSLWNDPQGPPIGIHTSGGDLAISMLSPALALDLNPSGPAALVPEMHETLSGDRVLTPVPGPGALGVLAIGAAMILGRRRR